MSRLGRAWAPIRRHERGWRQDGYLNDVPVLVCRSERTWASFIQSRDALAAMSVWDDGRVALVFRNDEVRDDLFIVLHELTHVWQLRLLGHRLHSWLYAIPRRLFGKRWGYRLNPFEAHANVCALIGVILFWLDVLTWEDYR